MGSSSATKEQTVASEKYQPALNDYYNERFNKLVERMSHNLPINRAAIIKGELDKIDVDNSDNKLETLKYASSLSVLIDLSLQGWIFDIDEDSLTLKMENDNLDDKQKLRYRLSAEKNAQFKAPSVAAFIRKMESNKIYQGNNISVRDLIGDKHFLIQQIKNGQRVCDPYIQLVTGERDTLTGYKLSDIWRYFRFTWSIPYKTIDSMIFSTADREYNIKPALISYFESFCEEDISPIVALSRALQIVLYTFEYKNNSPSDFCRVLGVRSGLIGPKGNRAKTKRYLLNSFTLETITLSALSTDEINEGLELKDLGERLFDAYNILIGADSEREYGVLEDYNIAQATPGDLRGDLSVNAQKIANTYISLGLGKRYADGVTLIGWRL